MTRLTLTRRAAPNYLSDRSPAETGGRNFYPGHAATLANEDAFVYGVLACVSLLFIAFGLAQDTPAAIMAGFSRIICSTNILGSWSSGLIAVGLEMDLIP